MVQLRYFSACGSIVKILLDQVDIKDENGALDFPKFSATHFSTMDSKDHLGLEGFVFGV